MELHIRNVSTFPQGMYGLLGPNGPRNVHADANPGHKAEVRETLIAVRGKDGTRPCDFGALNVYE